MNTIEMLKAIPNSYDDFVVDTAAWMEKDEDIRAAVLKRLDENKDSTPSDILKIIFEHLGMNQPLEIIDDEPETKSNSSRKRKIVAAL